MDEVGAPGSGAFLTTSELAGRDDYALGRTAVSPSRRVITGPGGSAEVEPRVMQVLTVLADSRNRVVTRHTLFERCWGVTDVGDDSLNRAIAAVRKYAVEIGAGSFAVETIPRTGYRLTAEAAPCEEKPAEAAAAQQPRLSRRAVIGTTAAAVALGGAGFLAWSARQDDRRVRSLIDRGVQGLEYGDGSLEPAKYFQRAVEIDPERSDAQGLLAYALSADTDNVGNWGYRAVVNKAEKAAKTALELDPSNVNAQLALVLLRRASMDLISTEEQLTRLLAAAPANIFVMRSLWNLYQSTGRSEASLAIVERAMKVRPLAAAANYPFGQLLWIVGRPAEADRILERAIQYWPDHRYVRFARYTLLAFTERESAALRMLESPATAPQSFTPEALVLLRQSLETMMDPSPAKRSAFLSASVKAVDTDVALARYAILPLAQLGEVDTAFEIANQLLLFSLPQTGQARGPKATSIGWRFTPWLFTPPAASMRADPRFASLCEASGLTDYWRRRGIRPDFMNSAIPPQR